MTLLILGGTADGRKLARKLHLQGVSVIYSVAGLVRIPDEGCQVISGGFSQFGGLIAYIHSNKVAAILDVTHPYAQIMSTKAIEAAKQCHIPCWRFHRSAWQASEGDDWQIFGGWQAIAERLPLYKSVFLTCGQLTQKQVDGLAANPAQKILLRTAVKPSHALPSNMQWIKAIGPFDREGEQSLMSRHAVDVLVSKNSGGDSTSAKLAVASVLGIPVLMLDRPSLPKSDREFTTHAECEAYVLSRFPSLFAPGELNAF